MESGAKSAGINGGHRKDVGGAAAAAVSAWARLAELVLRFFAFAATLVAAIVMGVAKETTTVSLQLVPTLPALAITATAKFSYSSAFVYFVVANAIACGYSVLSLVIAVASKGKTRSKLALLVCIMDLIMVALLFSGVGAAAAVGVIGEQGNRHVGWNKVCNSFGKFCTHVMSSAIVSLFGALAYVLVASIRFVNLHK